MATVFLIIGGLGLLLITASLLFGDVLDVGSFDVDGPFSLAAIATFVSAFGLGGAAATALLPDLGVLTLVLAVAAGLFAAVPAAWFAVRLTRSVMHMPTDATPTRADLIGTSGVVVSPIPQDGYGQVRLQVAGQPVKYNARAESPIPNGATVFVVGTPSATSVVVEPMDSILPGS